jgi:hypothetical protein
MEEVMFDSVDDNCDGWEGDERGDVPRRVLYN